MTKLKFFLIFFLAFTILLTGCGQSNSTGAGTDTDLTSLLSKVKKYDSLTYQMTTEVNNQNVTSKMFFKNDNFRAETQAMGQKTVMIYNKQTNKSYMYMPDTNIGMTISMDQTKQFIDNTPSKLADSILSLKPQIIGQETIDGKNCLIVEYTYENMKIKQWLDQDSGLIRKLETHGDGVDTVTYFTNYDFSAISDSMFELPKGIEMMDLGNLPNLNQ